MKTPTNVPRPSTCTGIHTQCRRSLFAKKKIITASTHRKLFASSSTKSSNTDSSSKALFEWMNDVQQKNISRFEDKYGFSILKEKPVPVRKERFVWTPVVHIAKVTISVTNN
mmetsp:Transcript_1510/g.5160  ORF Transcript_1510/g.5160 Transcript_1510/m.5160 type:complete len:112 (-) Transcript_1510:3194-3529(-)